MLKSKQSMIIFHKTRLDAPNLVIAPLHDYSQWMYQFFTSTFLSYGCITPSYSLWKQQVFQYLASGTWRKFLGCGCFTSLLEYEEVVADSTSAILNFSSPLSEMDLHNPMTKYVMYTRQVIKQNMAAIRHFLAESWSYFTGELPDWYAKNQMLTAMPMVVCTVTVVWTILSVSLPMQEIIIPMMPQTSSESEGRQRTVNMTEMWAMLVCMSLVSL